MKYMKSMKYTITVDKNFNKVIFQCLLAAGVFVSSHFSGHQTQQFEKKYLSNSVLTSPQWSRCLQCHHGAKPRTRGDSMVMFPRQQTAKQHTTKDLCDCQPPELTSLLNNLSYVSTRWLTLCTFTSND